MTAGDTPPEGPPYPVPGVTAPDPAPGGAMGPGRELLAVAGPVPPCAARLPRVHEGLTARQVRALVALVTCRGPVEASRRANVPPRTLFDWRGSNAAFRRAYYATLDALHADALRSLAPALAEAGAALAAGADGTRGIWPTIAAARATLEAAGLIEPGAAAASKVDALRKELRRLAERVRVLEGRLGVSDGRGG